MSFIPPSLRDAWGQLNIWSPVQAADGGWLQQEPISALEDRAILAGELPGLLEEARSVAIIERTAGVSEPNVRGIAHAIDVDGLVSVAYSKEGGYFDAGQAIEVRIRWAEVER